MRRIQISVCRSASILNVGAAISRPLLRICIGFRRIRNIVPLKKYVIARSAKRDVAISYFHASISSAETSIVPGDSHVGLSGLLGMTVVFAGFRTDFAATNCQITMSLRGAKRRGNLLLLCIDKQCRNKHRTGRFPRRPFWPPRNDSGFRWLPHRFCCYQLPNYHVIARSEATWQSPASMYR